MAAFTVYLIVRKNILKQDSYTIKKKRNQVLLPINFEEKIPEDDSVRLLVEIYDELDYTNLYKAYDRKRRSLSPETMFEILVHGYMRGIC